MSGPPLLPLSPTARRPLSSQPHLLSRPSPSAPPPAGLTSPSSYAAILSASSVHASSRAAILHVVDAGLVSCRHYATGWPRPPPQSRCEVSRPKSRLSFCRRTKVTRLGSSARFQNHRVEMRGREEQEGEIWPGGRRALACGSDTLVRAVG
jgi:hypothetical protein